MNNFDSLIASEKFQFSAICYIVCQIVKNTNFYATIVMASYIKKLYNKLHVPTEDEFIYLVRKKYNIREFMLAVNDLLNCNLHEFIENFEFRDSWQENFSPYIWYLIHILTILLDTAANVSIIEKYIFIDLIDTSILCSFCSSHYKKNKTALKMQLSGNGPYMLTHAFLKLHSKLNSPNKNFFVYYQEEYQKLANNKKEGKKTQRNNVIVNNSYT